MVTIHQGLVDQNGNFRDRSRKKEGYLTPKFDDSKPFAALVTAWFPYSQTINISYWKDWYQTEQENVVVYGNFMESVGTLYTPKIATDKGKNAAGTVLSNTWQTYKNPDPSDPKSNPTSDEYVLDNHIEALVVKTNTGYAATAFRTITPDSPLLKNAKYGRKLTRHDDGSYRIHDDDGNIQFKHPSGLSIKIGKDGDDIPLESPFPEHAKNVQDYAGKILSRIIVPSNVGNIIVIIDGEGSIKIEHPVNNFVFDINQSGKLEVSNSTTDLRVLVDTLNDIVGAIVVNDGVGPNIGNLANLKTANATLLK